MTVLATAILTVKVPTAKFFGSASVRNLAPLCLQRDKTVQQCGENVIHKRIFNFCQEMKSEIPKNSVVVDLNPSFVYFTRLTSHDLTEIAAYNGLISSFVEFAKESV